ncbi:diacylglycerol kinase family protein [Bacillus testis]|uniref:diacylglycerol kinase family protein n=1 Tax=Bacillus testis TaxID=1622072 RepID=UPI00067ECC7A|nr:diacylglycerol kinase family protein [Bacillus testis]
MAYPGSDKHHSFAKSVGFALAGIKWSFRERNMKIHYFMAVAIVMAGCFFSLTKVEWLFILSCVGGVIALEMLNTAIEAVVDLVTDEFHELARIAKDTAAGAVLVYSIYSLIVGIIIFFPKMLSIVA